MKPVIIIKRLFSLTAIKTGLLALVMLLPGQANAADEIYTRFFSDLALNGYDSVAYFSEGKAVEGKAKYRYQYKGAQWHFSSQTNVEKFKSTPEAYAPQYGGHCAWALARNATASGDPLYWNIVQGKLYLNYDADIKAKWEKDSAGFIKKADQYWPEVLN
jgi:YHS domain-containing protein